MCSPHQQLNNGWRCSAANRRGILNMERIELSSEMTQFVTERHLASLTIVTPKGRPHVTPVGFTWDEERQLVRVITWAGSTKAKILDKSENPLRAAVSQVDGGRWVTLEGLAVVTSDDESAVKEPVDMPNDIQNQKTEEMIGELLNLPLNG